MKKILLLFGLLFGVLSGQAQTDYNIEDAIDNLLPPGQQLSRAAIDSLFNILNIKCVYTDSTSLANNCTPTSNHIAIAENALWVGNGSNWNRVAGSGSGGGGATSLSGLTDVTITAATTGEGIYNNGSGQFIDKLADSTNIVDGGVISADIKDLTITGSDIAPATISNTKIVPGTITTNEIANSTIQTEDIGADEVTSSDILDGTIANVDIAADAVTSGKVLDNTLTSSDLAPNSVLGSELGNNVVGSGHLADDAVGLAAIDPAGGSNNQVLGISGGNPAWINQSGGGGSAGLPAINLQTGSTYTLAVGDSIALIIRANASANTTQIPLDATANLPIGSTVTVVWDDNSAGQPEIILEAGVAFEAQQTSDAKYRIRAQGEAATLIKRAANQWVGIGAWETPEVGVDHTVAGTPAADQVIIAVSAAEVTGDAGLLFNRTTDNLTVGNNISLSGTVDGRDVAADGTKEDLFDHPNTGSNNMVLVNNAATDTDWAFIVGSNISSNTITNSHMTDNAIGANEIVAGGVTTTEIANGTITAADIANTTILNVNLATDAVTSGKVQDNSLTSSDLGANSVLSSN
jgi:hypothetical protein